MCSRRCRQPIRHPPASDTPEPRAHHSVKLWGDNMLVYGGEGRDREGPVDSTSSDDGCPGNKVSSALGGVLFGDLWRLDLSDAAAAGERDGAQFGEVSPRRDSVAPHTQ